MMQHSPVWREDLADWWFTNNKREAYTGFDRDQLVSFLLKYRNTTPQPKGLQHDQQAS
jgi:hypothetical protein